MDDGLKPLEALTPAETRARALDYRLLAATARTARVKDALVRLARMLEQRAAEKDAQDTDRVHSGRGAFASGYADGRSIVIGRTAKTEGARLAPFRTAYEAGYECGRIDAEIIALRLRTGLRQGQCVAAVPTVTDHL